METGRPTSRAGGGVRGECREFSRGARNRARRALAGVDLRHRAVFVTLTVPEGAAVGHDPRAFKGRVSVWWKRVERRWPRAASVWVIEPHKTGRVHAHLLVWGVNAGALRAWIGPAWAEVCDVGHEAHARAGTRVDAVRSARGVQEYVASYLSARQKHGWGEYRGPDGQPVTVGRCWGRLGFDKGEDGERVWRAPQSPVCELVGTDRAAARLVRVGRRLLAANIREGERAARAAGKKVRPRHLPRSLPSLTILSGNVETWKRVALAAGMIEREALGSASPVRALPAPKTGTPSAPGRGGGDGPRRLPDGPPESREGAGEGRRVRGLVRVEGHGPEARANPPPLAAPSAAPG